MVLLYSPKSSPHIHTSVGLEGLLAAVVDALLHDRGGLLDKEARVQLSQHLSVIIMNLKVNRKCSQQSYHNFSFLQSNSEIKNIELETLNTLPLNHNHCERRRDSATI